MTSLHAAPRHHSTNRAEEFLISLWDNIMFVLWGGIAGYAVGHLVAKLGHVLGFYLADNLHTEYALRWQMWVFYGSLWGTALLFAYAGLAFARITKRQPEPEQVEADIPLAEPEPEPVELPTGREYVVTSWNTSTHDEGR